MNDKLEKYKSSSEKLQNINEFNYDVSNQNNEIQKLINENINNTKISKKKTSKSKISDIDYKKKEKKTKKNK